MYIQTTYRLSIPEIPEIRIGFEGVELRWIYCTVELNTGVLKDFSEWPPNDVMPGWHTDNPLQKWTIECPLGRLHLEGSVCKFSEPKHLAKMLDTLTNQTVCALWTGRYGYSIEN